MISLQACNFIKKRLQRKCFSVNIANFLTAAFSIEHLWWLLLKFRGTRKLNAQKKAKYYSNLTL